MKDVNSLEQKVTKIITEGLKLDCWDSKTDTFTCLKLLKGQRESCISCLVIQILNSTTDWLFEPCPHSEPMMLTTRHECDECMDELLSSKIERRDNFHG